MNSIINIEIMKPNAIHGFLIGFLFKEKILDVTRGVINNSLLLFHRIKYRIDSST
jgi:hypothetical protein